MAKVLKSKQCRSPKGKATASLLASWHFHHSSDGSLVLALVFTRPSPCRLHSDQQAGAKTSSEGSLVPAYARVHSGEVWPEPVLANRHYPHSSSR